MVVKEEPTLSAFERKRQENIKQNNAILKGIESTADKIIPAKPSPKRTPAKRNRTAPSSRVKREVAVPNTTRVTRSSQRGTAINGSDDNLKRKSPADLQAQNEQARAKRSRISGDLKLDDIPVEGRKWESSVEGLSLLKGLSVRGAQPGVRTFDEEDEIKATTDKTLKDLKLRMSGLKLYEKWPVADIKLVPQRIYAMGFHPTEDKPIIFAGDKEGAMGVFDASQEPIKTEDDDDEEEATYSDPVISAFKTHSRTITGFLFSPADANAVYTSSYDSSIRKLDLEKSVSTQVFAPEDANEELGISALDMPSSDPNIVIFSTLQGLLGRHDIRTKAGDAEIWGLHDNKIGGFSLHPVHSHLVATASLDRTMKIWDLRKIQGKGDMRKPALLGEHDSRLSVSHASWSSAGHIATSSYDDTIKIYSFPDAGQWKAGVDLTEQQMTPVHQVRHNNQTGRWVTILKPQWQRRPKDGLHKFAIGNMNRFVDIFAANGDQLAQLEGEGITAVPAVAHFHPTMDWVAGGNASGKLSLWM
ncbi:WD40-repeat-containing domain protein [Podospora australis]|uniref:DNA damage-binding protein CMR1 n=1 Tax=Podospora australis TaxID=1536484 RepID=A0AAN6WPK7_9PEZI|nr:WD40-repeat-containing domain protein [Podospora australis]